MFARFKDPFSGLSHLLTALFATAGTVYALQKTEVGSNAWISVLIYGISLIFLFLSSATYHLVRTTASRELLLRKIDHSAIFLFIAGTYTPVCVMLLEGTTRLAMLIAIWSLAAIGVASKIFIVGKRRWLSVSLYLGMGWLAVGVIGKLWAALPPAGLFWLFFGGLLYTAGAVVYATKRFDFYPGKFGFHEVWHLFVSAASIAHFVLIAFYII